MPMSARSTAAAHLKYLHGPKGNAFLQNIVDVHKNGCDSSPNAGIWGVSGRDYNFKMNKNKTKRLDFRVTQVLIPDVMSHLYHQNPIVRDEDMATLLGVMNGVTGLAELVISYGGGMDTPRMADKRVREELRAESHVLYGLKAHYPYSMSYYMWSLMHYPGFRGAHDSSSFVVFMASYIKHHGMYAVAMLLTMGPPDDSDFLSAVEPSLVVEGLNCGLEALNAPDTRCMRSDHDCICMTLREEANEDEQASPKRIKI